MINFSSNFPLVDRPLVDWDLILVMEPLTIAGALIGAFLNKLLPGAILVVSLVALLTFTAYKTLKKSVRIWDKREVQRSCEAHKTRRLYSNKHSF